MPLPAPYGLPSSKVAFRFGHKPVVPTLSSVRANAARQEFIKLAVLHGLRWFNHTGLLKPIGSTRLAGCQNEDDRSGSPTQNLEKQLTHA